MKTSIEWTEVTWNPVRGCSRVSQGCRHCYAERQAGRFSIPGQSFHGFVQRTDGKPHWTGQVELIPEKLTEPLRWKRPRKVFVNSMSDLFHENLSDGAIAAVWSVMEQTPQHTYQVLTKRPDRMVRFLLEPLRALPNVWLGVSVENQRAANNRIPYLLAAPAALRFVSYEPALGPVDFRLAGAAFDWLIIGGESGPVARPFDIEWARQAIEQRVPPVAVFVKQLGSNAGSSASGKWTPLGLRDRKGAAWEEWPADLRVREWPRAAAAEASV